MTAINHPFALVSLALVLAACGGGDPKVDLGDDNSMSVAQGLAAYQGAWDGYAEAYKFESGSDRVRITLDATGQGTIELGDSPAISPFTDPSVGYPTSWPFDSETYQIYSHSVPHEGFGYPVADAAVTSGRLSFIFWGTDLVKDWCEAHEPTPGSTCGASRSYGQNGTVCTDEAGEPIDCGLLKTCAHACTCDEDSCTSRRDEWERMELDGALTADGDELVGTLVVVPASHGFTGSLEPQDRVTVRLTR
jgi:hypothetical protein